jgi:glycosyltransferase involved in cell wall biosynthesis
VLTPEPSEGRKAIQGSKNYTFAKLLTGAKKLFSEMKIGILGTRGIPNVYGGFEQFAQYLALGLVRKGYEVYVYNSSEHPYRDKEWNGVHIIHCRDWEKSIGTAGQFIYDYNCLRDAVGRDFDVLLQLGYTSNSIWHSLWPRKAINVINMDGQEWKRSKYNKLTRKFLRLAEGWAVKYGDILIADSVGIRDYIRAAYGRESIYIAYGAVIPATFDPEIPGRYGLKRDGYYLLIARMEPENNIEMIIRGWMASGMAKPLVLIGNTGNSFGSYLVRTYSQEKLHFIGAIYEADTVNALRHYSSIYLHGHSVGGTNPSLLEAMACGCSIAAHDNPFNKAILNGEGWFFSDPLTIKKILDNRIDPEVIAGYKEKNREKIGKLYNWEHIINQYESVFLQTDL